MELDLRILRSYQTPNNDLQNGVTIPTLGDRANMHMIVHDHMPT
jgi:hypothetical protein